MREWFETTREMVFREHLLLHGLDNHDTGKEHDKWVTKDWHMGYAYILTHEGRPCIFYPHYYGVTLIDNHDPSKTVSIPSWLQNNINELIFVTKNLFGR
jgi:alpha-amylase